jgi:hypothetical protein
MGDSLSGGQLKLPIGQKFDLISKICFIRTSCAVALERFRQHDAEYEPIDDLLYILSQQWWQDRKRNFDQLIADSFSNTCFFRGDW